jgi:glycosyltransferase involved in cell wall biosynthesis
MLEKRNEFLMEEYKLLTPLLSVVIPTRNRVPYAISAIQSILEISDPLIELVVMDNSDICELKLWIEKNIKDSRLRYKYIGIPLSFVSNFNAAIELTTGEYLCIIGDDDGVNPEIIKATEFIKQENIDCLAVKTTANYVWPDASIPPTIFTKVTGGILSISNFNGSIADSEVENEMQAFVRDGGASYLNFNLPKLYHGIVRRQCLEAIKTKTGAYFGGLSPDIYISLAIACVAKRVVITDYPLTLPGVCGVSASIIEGLFKKNSKKLEDAPHFRNRGNYKWCELIPRVYSVETIWADSGIAALRAMGREDLIIRFNLPKLAAYCVNANKGVIRTVIKGLLIGLKIMNKNQSIGKIQFLWFLINVKTYSFFYLFRRIWNRLNLIFGKKNVQRISGLNNMVEASNALTLYLKENGHSFNKCV